MSSTPELQQTVAKSASVSGTSLHTGEKVTLRLQPAPVDFGIKFKRKDLQDEPTIDARIENLKTVERATTIGEGAMRVHTVEHILSALSAMGVDNVIIEMDANEPPIGDGSAQPYVELIKKAGVVAQEAPRRNFVVREPIHIETKGGSLLVVLPDDKFRISCTQVGPEGRFSQFLSTEITPAIFEREIAPARTFVFYEDVQPLMEKNLIKGGSLENAIVVRGEAVLSKEPLRFPMNSSGTKSSISSATSPCSGIGSSATSSRSSPAMARMPSSRAPSPKSGSRACPRSSRARFRPAKAASISIR